MRKPRPREVKKLAHLLVPEPGFTSKAPKDTEDLLFHSVLLLERDRKPFHENELMLFDCPQVSRSTRSVTQLSKATIFDCTRKNGMLKTVPQKLGQMCCPREQDRLLACTGVSKGCLRGNLQIGTQQVSYTVPH